MSPVWAGSRSFRRRGFVFGVAVILAATTSGVGSRPRQRPFWGLNGLLSFHHWLRRSFADERQGFGWLVAQGDPKVSKNPAGFLLTSIKSEYLSLKSFVSREEQAAKDAKATDRRKREEERARLGVSCRGLPNAGRPRRRLRRSGR